MDYFICYLFFTNCISFTAFGLDKYRARKHKYRIPERTLFLLAVFGGSIGAGMGMFIFRHKIRNRLFLFGIPLLLAVHCAALIFMCQHFK